MEKFEIYDDIKERTNGDIYIGVVGPVRVGKSTFITQFMQRLVLPNISEKNSKERTIDELPQSADGKTIMTTQPHFVPNEAVKIKVANAEMSVRMIDCVGYLISGAMGHIEGEKPRLVKTPWTDEEIPFEDAATLGTDKVIKEHSTIGIMVTTDGSVTDIARSNYIEAEEKVVKELKAVGKPFVIVLNSAHPQNNETKKLATSLQEKYDAPVIPLNALDLKENDVDKIFENLLMEFPVKSIRISMPDWLRALDFNSAIISEISNEMRNLGSKINKLSDADKNQIAFAESDCFDPITYSNIEAGQGVIKFNVIPKEGLFYRVLSEECGIEIKSDYELISNIKELSIAKIEYDKLKNALEQVSQTGYGVVEPKPTDFELGEPEIIKQGTRFGVKLKARAPSIHMIKAEIETEVSPIVGSEKQSQELVEQYRWDDIDYLELNVIYKASKNAGKFKSVLEKHKTKIIKIGKIFLNRERGKKYE